MLKSNFKLQDSLVFTKDYLAIPEKVPLHNFYYLGNTKNGEIHLLLLHQVPVDCSRLTLNPSKVVLSSECSQYIVQNGCNFLVGSLFSCNYARTYFNATKIIVGHRQNVEDKFSFYGSERNGVLIFRGSNSNLLIIPIEFDNPLLAVDLLV